MPQHHFLAAWSSILGHTSLPGNEFSLALASRSPEDLAGLALANHRGVDVGSLYDPDGAGGTSLFPQGSMIVTEECYNWTVNQEYYDWTVNQFSYGAEEVKRTCPGPGVVPDQCDANSTECPSPMRDRPAGGGPSVNGEMGLRKSHILPTTQVPNDGLPNASVLCDTLARRPQSRHCWPSTPSSWHTSSQFSPWAMARR